MAIAFRPDDQSASFAEVIIGLIYHQTLGYSTFSWFVTSRLICQLANLQLSTNNFS